MNTKNLKKGIVIGLLMGIVGAITPFGNVNAQSLDVGINVTNVPAYDATLTLSSDITVDAKNKTVSDAYITAVNNTSLTPIQLYVTDIEALTTGAPSNFISFTTDTSLDGAGKDTTATMISFGLDLNGNNKWVDIMPNKQVDLGMISGGYGGDAVKTVNSVDYLTNSAKINGDRANNSAIYKLGVHVGYAWDSTKQLKYAITSVVSVPEESWQDIDKTFANSTFYITGGNILSMIDANGNLLIITSISEDGSSNLLPLVSESTTGNYFKTTITKSDGTILSSTYNDHEFVGTDGNNVSTYNYFGVFDKDSFTTGIKQYLTVKWQIIDGTNGKVLYTASDLISYTR